MDYPIDVICVLTIERVYRRHESWLGSALHPLSGIPPEIVEFHLGPDGKDYTSLEEVAEAARADGFSWVENYALGTRTKYVQQTPSSVAQSWGYGKILKYLVETQQTGLIIWDDKMLTVPFQTLCDALDKLQDSEKEFFMWQLILRGHPGEVQLDTHNINDRTKNSQLIFDALMKGELLHPCDFLVQEGIKGYDETMIFSPQGAEWMLERLENADEFHIFLDHFICFELTHHAKVYYEKYQKGFYCPAEFGYNFAKVYRAMGTLTNWAHEDSLHFEESRHVLNPTYIKY